MFCVSVLICVFLLVQTNSLSRSYVNIINVPFDQDVTFNISKAEQYLYQFVGNLTNVTENPFISLTTSVVGHSSNVWFDVEFQDDDTSTIDDTDPKYWMLPTKSDRHEFIQIFCSKDFKTDNQNNAVVPVRVSTTSAKLSTFHMFAKFENYVYVQNLDEQEVPYINTTSTAHLLLQLGRNVLTESTYAMLELTSEDEICATVFLKWTQCTAETEKNGGVQIRSLTMSGNAVMYLPVMKMQNDFALSFLVHGNDQRCKGSEGYYFFQSTYSSVLARKKQISFRFTQGYTAIKYTNAQIVLILFLAIFILALCIKLVLFIRSRVKKSSEFTEPVLQSDEPELIEGTEPLHFLLCFKGTPSDNIPSIGTLLALIFSLYMFSHAILHVYNTYHNEFLENGNEDVCHFNFKCLRPQFGFLAFNHMLSSAFYVLFGVVFLIWVGDKKAHPSHIFWMALGTSIILHGISSAVFNMCPYSFSRQFDFVFTYVTVILCTLALYMTRSADMKFGLIKVEHMKPIVNVLVLVLLKNHSSFWLITSIFHLFFSLFLSVHIQSIEDQISWNFAMPPICNWKLMFQSLWKPFWKMQTILRWNNIVNLVLFVISWTMCEIGWLSYPAAFGVHVGGHLFFVMNPLAIQVLFQRQEKYGQATVVYGVVVVLIIITFLIVYLAAYATDRTPAESRMQNRDCIAFSFFDLNDILRIVASLATFLLCMFLYNITYQSSEMPAKSELKTEQTPLLQSLKISASLEGTFNEENYEDIMQENYCNTNKEENLNTDELKPFDPEQENQSDTVQDN